MKNLVRVLGKALYLFFPILFVTGCNSSGNEIKNTHAVDTVVIKQMQFFPHVIEVKPGDTIIWINKDMVPHNITEQKSKSFYSDTLEVGKSWKMKVKDSASYYCSIHPTMTGKITVK